MAPKIVSPAGDGAVVEDGTSVVAIGGDCGGGAAGAEVDGCAWCGGVGVVAVAKLTSIVITPALYGAVVEDGAGVVVSGGDCGGGAVGAEVDGCAWFVGVGVGFVAKLTPIVISPAGDGGIVEECAGVVVAGGDCGGGAAGAEVDGCAWCVGVVGVAVAKLTSIVITPALYGAVVEDGASMSATGGDCGCGTTNAEVEGVAWRAGVVGVAVAELPFKI